MVRKDSKYSRKLQEEYSDFGKLLYDFMKKDKRVRWTQNKLAKEACISQSRLSRAMRGRQDYKGYPIKLDDRELLRLAIVLDVGEAGFNQMRSAQDSTVSYALEAMKLGYTLRADIDGYLVEHDKEQLFGLVEIE